MPSPLPTIMVAQQVAATLTAGSSADGANASAGASSLAPLATVAKLAVAQAATAWHETVALAADAATDAEADPWWALGMGLMVIGTIASSVGLLCFKRAGSSNGAAWYMNTWFWGGLILFFMTAAVLDTVVFAVTPLGLIAPFAGLTIVVSFALASFGCCGVHEPPTKTATAAVILIVCGVTVCAVFGPKADGTITPRGLQEQFDQHPFLYVICSAGGPLFLAFYAFSVCRPAETRKALRTWMGALGLALAAAGFGSVTQLQFKALANAILTVLTAMTGEHRSYSDIKAIYPSSGVCFTQLCCVASTGLAQIGFLNFAISGAPVAYTVPAYQSALLVSTLVVSGCVLNEYSKEPALHLIIFWTAASVIILGMLLNAWGLARATRAGRRENDGSSKADDELPGAHDAEAAVAAKRAAAQRYQ